ncbi:MAG: SUMF1/EgtB/PvdO family nonheme iron enzyme [Verrucomicrobia bacterium]|nr:SUMF1/EgtB/PvdO family nonheme iron enzyme [Verrucomicrobiota bacterium]
MKLPILLALLNLPASAAVSIDWVTIGDPGNAAQSAANRTHFFGSGGDSYGAVADTFRMSRNETTIAQYAAFLNAKASSDPYGLWNSSMASDRHFAGITRSGTSGSYTYSVTGSGLRPITYVSWFDAARYTNWINNGQGSGDTETGAYTLVGGQISGTAPARNVGATVWIPTENEWFKAAYYDPTHISGAGGYWLHANQSNSMTSNNMTHAGAANYHDGNQAIAENGLPSILSDVGAYGQDSQNYYLLSDMAGNVMEWNDLLAESGALRGVRGGYWNMNEIGQQSDYRLEWSTSFEFNGLGFRLAAAIPEPSSLVLSLLASGAFLTRRRRHPEL